MNKHPEKSCKGYSSNQKKLFLVLSIIIKLRIYVIEFIYTYICNTKNNISIQTRKRFFVVLLKFTFKTGKNWGWKINTDNNKARNVNIKLTELRTQ